MMGKVYNYYRVIKYDILASCDFKLIFFQFVWKFNSRVVILKVVLIMDGELSKELT